jgi:hypothetical protein
MYTQLVEATSMASGSPYPAVMTVREALTSPHYFKRAKSACNFPEVRRNRITITTHFVKLTDPFFSA